MEITQRTISRSIEAFWQAAHKCEKQSSWRYRWRAISHELSGMCRLLSSMGYSTDDCRLLELIAWDHFITNRFDNHRNAA